MFGYNPCNKKTINYIKSVGLLLILTIANTGLIHSIDDHINNTLICFLLHFASNLTFIGLFYGIYSYCNKKHNKINNLVSSLNTLSKEQICVNTSHKIRNPLQEILSALDTLKQKLPSSSSTRNLSNNPIPELLIISNAIKQLERTADELLELSGTTQLMSRLSINNPITFFKRNKDLNSLNILVVDDNEINRVFLKNMLEKLSHNVVTATNGQEAVDLVLNQTTSIFNVIFIDIEMPIMDGITATRMIRKTFNKDILPIIACTSHGSSDDLEAFKAAGMNDTLLKPTNINKIIYALSRLNINEPNIEPEPLSSPSSLLKRPGSFSEGVLNSYTSNLRLNYSDLNSSDLSENNTPPNINQKKMFPN
jgi:CheY-like chemotaxis protein